MDLESELSALRHLPRVEVRRAALAVLQPELRRQVDEVGQDPARLVEVQYGDLEVVLACLEPGVAARAAAADPRQRAAAALGRAHPDAELPELPVRELLESGMVHAPAQDLRSWICQGSVEPSDALALARRKGRSIQRFAVVEALLELHDSQGCSEALLDEARRLFVDQMWGRLGPTEEPAELSWGRLVEKVPVSWWGSGGPLASYTALVLWDGIPEAPWVAEVVDACGMTPAAARSVVALANAPGGNRRLFSDQLVLLDRACATLRCDPPAVTSHAAEVVVALPHLRPTPMAATLRQALLAGELGWVCEARHAAAVERLELSPAELAPLLGDEALAVWVGRHGDAEVAELLAHAGAEMVDAATMADGWADRDALDRFCALACTHTPGMLAALCEHGEDPVTAAVMRVLDAELGADPLAWQALWSIAPTWPSTVPAAVECVRACQR